MGNNRNKISLYLSIIAMLVIWGNYVFASTYIANPDRRIELKISKSGINRISMFPYAISQVTGDESLYRLRSDNDGQNIYIMPLGKIGSKIELSLKSNIGIVQDLSLEVAAINGTSTVINMSGVNKAETILADDIEAKLMMKSMMQGIKGKYYVKPAKRKIKNDLGLRIKQTRTYRFKQLTGVTLEIFNASKVTKQLGMNVLSELFKNTLAVSIENNESSLESKGMLRAFVITKEEHFDA